MFGSSAAHFDLYNVMHAVYPARKLQLSNHMEIGQTGRWLDHTARDREFFEHRRPNSGQLAAHNLLPRMRISSFFCAHFKLISCCVRVFFFRFQCCNRGTNHHNKRMSVWIIYYLIYSNRSETLVELVGFLFERARTSDDDRYLIVAWLDSTRCLVYWYACERGVHFWCFNVRKLHVQRSIFKDKSKKERQIRNRLRKRVLGFYFYLRLRCRAIQNRRWKWRKKWSSKFIWDSSVIAQVVNGHTRNVRIAIQQWKWPMWMTA